MGRLPQGTRVNRVFLTDPEQTKRERDVYLRLFDESTAGGRLRLLNLVLGANRGLIRDDTGIPIHRIDRIFGGGHVTRQELDAIRKSMGVFEPLRATRDRLDHANRMSATTPLPAKTGGA